MDPQEQANQPTAHVQGAAMPAAPPKTDVASGEHIFGKNLPKHEQNDQQFTQFKEGASFNFPLFICWIVAAMALMGTLYLWWISQNETEILKDKKAKLQEINQQLATPSNVELEKKANAFKSSVTELKSAFEKRYSYTVFLNELYQKTTTDVQLKSVSVSEDGSVSLTGVTDSYRSVADLMIVLGAWDKISNLDLASVSMSIAENRKPEVTFSISSKLVKIDPKTALTTTSVGTSATPSTSAESSTAPASPAVNGGVNATE